MILLKTSHRILYLDNLNQNLAFYHIIKLVCIDYHKFQTINQEIYVRFQWLASLSGIKELYRKKDLCYQQCY